MPFDLVAFDAKWAKLDAFPEDKTHEIMELFSSAPVDALSLRQMLIQISAVNEQLTAQNTALAKENSKLKRQAALYSQGFTTLTNSLTNIIEGVSDQTTEKTPIVPPPISEEITVKPPVG